MLPCSFIGEEARKQKKSRPDTQVGEGSGEDKIISGDGVDHLAGNGGRDIFVCGEGEDDTVTDYNEVEGDIATPDCENI